MPRKEHIVQMYSIFMSFVPLPAKSGNISKIMAYQSCPVMRMLQHAVCLLESRCFTWLGMQYDLHCVLQRHLCNQEVIGSPIVFLTFDDAEEMDHAQIMQFKNCLVAHLYSCCTESSK